MKETILQENSIGACEKNKTYENQAYHYLWVFDGAACIILNIYVCAERLQRARDLEGICGARRVGAT